MLTLTRTQTDTLAEDRSLRTIYRIVQETLPRRVASETNPRRLVASLIQLGKKYGVRTERGVARFVCLALIRGEQQMRKAEVQEAFKRNRLSADALVNRMLKQTSGGGAPDAGSR
jgi:DNA-binding PucR family transcriptional regulator